MFLSSSGLMLCFFRTCMLRSERRMKDLPHRSHILPWWIFWLCRSLSSILVKYWLQCLHCIVSLRLSLCKCIWRFKLNFVTKFRSQTVHVYFLFLLFVSDVQSTFSVIETFIRDTAPTLTSSSLMMVTWNDRKLYILQHLASSGVSIIYLWDSVLGRFQHKKFWSKCWYINMYYKKYIFLVSLLVDHSFPRANVTKYYCRLLLIHNVWRATIFPVKPIKMLTLWVYITIPFGFSLF